MNPVLYYKNENDYSMNGIGVLADCISGNVIEERNGMYECSFTYPISGAFYSEIVPDRIIKVKPNETSNLQLFRIKAASKVMNGLQTFYAEHISYDLNKNIVPPLANTTANATALMQHIIGKASYTSTFTAYSDIETAKTFSTSIPMSIRKCLGGVEGSILDLFRGEYEFDNYTVKLHQNRGEDNGVRIAYGKNLTGLNSNIDISSTYTAIFPYCVNDNQETIQLPEKVIELSSAANYGCPRVKDIDLSDKFAENEEMTVEKLRQKANAYLAGNSIDSISQNIVIDFVSLYQTKEYANIANLERVRLCDIVTVEHPQMGINVKAKCIKTTYDFVNERMLKIELGNARSNFVSTVNTISTVTGKLTTFAENSVSTTKKIANQQTALILGGDGGYVYFKPDSDGRVKEIYWMDTNDPDTAVHVLRINYQGIGFSSNGINGTYTTAWTLDGIFNANFIQSGVINGSLIKTGVIQDASGTTSIDLSTGKISVTQSESNKALDIYNSGVLIADKQTKEYIGGIWANPPQVSMPSGAFDSITLRDGALSSGSLDDYLMTLTKQKLSFTKYGSGTPMVKSEIKLSFNNSDGKAEIKTDRIVVNKTVFSPRAVTINNETFLVMASGGIYE